jgi:hypothetical protein
MNILETVILAAGLSALSFFLVRLYVARSFVSNLRSAQLVRLSSERDQQMRYNVSIPKDMYH